MKYKLSELCDVQIGRTPPRKEFDWFNTGSNSDFTWVSIKDLGECNKYIDFSSETISSNGQKKFNIPIVKSGTILLSFKLTVGRVAIATKDLLTNEAIAQLPIMDSSKVDRDFLYYYLLRYPWDSLGSTSSIATAVNSKMIKEMEVDIPNIAVQRKIAEILSTIDEKIIINTQINNNLEQQAKAIYHQMFVASPSLDRSQGTLSDIADITMGQSPRGSSYNEDGNGTVFYQGRGEFGYRFPTQRLFTTEPKRMAHENDVLMSVRAPVGDLNVAREDCCIGRGLASIRSKHNRQSFVLYTVFALQPELDKFNGEGTVFGSINRDSLNKMAIMIPTDDEMDRFESIVSPMDAQIRANHEEGLRLEAIREALLPKLLSGELDISDIEF